MIELEICDICNEPMPGDDHCHLYIQGVAEKLNCHARCIGIFMKCKGDFSKLPDGKLKSAIEANKIGETIVLNTGITIRVKQGRAIIDALKKSHEEGLRRIEAIAVDFYGLPKPSIDNGEFYSIDHDKQIVLMRKTDKPEEMYKIDKVSRDFKL